MTHILRQFLIARVMVCPKDFDYPARLLRPDHIRQAGTVRGYDQLGFHKHLDLFLDAQLLGENAIRDHPDDPAARGYVEDHGRFAEEDVQYATSYLGVQYVNRWQGTETYVYVQTEPPIWPAPDGFTYTMRVTAVPPNGPVRTVEGRDLRWVFAGGTTLRLELDDSPELEIDLVGLTPSLEEAATPPSNIRLPPEQMVFDAESDQVRVRLHLQSFGGRVFPDSLALNNVEGDVFIQFLDLIRP